MSIIARIETRLRAIIRDEVSRVGTDLSTERMALLATIRSLDVQVKSFHEALSKAVAQVAACSPPHQENAELRAHIKDLESQIVGFLDTAKKLHPELVK